MSFNDLQSLTKLTTIIQIAAVIFIVLGGLLQASRFFLDKKIDEMRSTVTKKEIKINDLRSKDALVQELRETISAQNNQIQEQSLTLNEQKIMIETQNKVISEGILKSSSRSIPKKNLDTLIKDLSKYEGDTVKISCSVDDAECFAFAMQLRTMFELAGWTVLGVHQAEFDKPVSGVKILLNNESLYPKVENLFAMMNALGIESSGDFKKDQDMEIEILVGPYK